MLKKLAYGSLLMNMTGGSQPESPTLKKIIAEFGNQSPSMWNF